MCISYSPFRIIEWSGGMYKNNSALTFHLDRGISSFKSIFLVKLCFSILIRSRAVKFWTREHLEDLSYHFLHVHLYIYTEKYKES